ncbi:MAG: CoA pyrophosphatase [Gemmatimonadales bacterium]|nr:CoA pyrophosphatase [Gemmatimonadales bacterium]
MLRWRLSRARALSRIPTLAARLAVRTPRLEDLPGHPKAAVAVILAPDPDRLLLIRRAEREGDRWSGQLAFPGGRWGEGDADLIATARRETLEEVGLDLTDAPLLGALDDLAPRTSALPPIVVRPFVFSVSTADLPMTNAEVADAWWIPLELFEGDGVFGPMEYSRYGTLIRSVGYHLPVGVLWGMTERILTPMLGLLR